MTLLRVLVKDFIKKNYFKNINQIFIKIINTLFSIPKLLSFFLNKLLVNIFQFLNKKCILQF